MRGEIISVNRTSGDGLISSEERRFSFTASSAPGSLYVGDIVGFDAVDGVATNVTLIRAHVRWTNEPYAVRNNDQGAQPRMWTCFVRCFTRKYIDGNGRATRKEYWSFVLFFSLFLFVPSLLTIGLSAISGDEFGIIGVIGLLIGLSTSLFSLFLWIPAITVLIRRFHDVGLSGWLILIGLIPYVGFLFNLVVAVLPSQSQTNKHGPNPLRRAANLADTFT